MITTFYPPYNYGGDGHFVHRLSRALTNRGHQVDIVHCLDAYRMKSPEPTIADSPADGLRIHRLSSRWSTLSPLISHQSGRPGLKGRKLRELLSESFDVINFHNVSLMGGPTLLGWGQAPVKLYTFHDHWLLCPTHFYWKNRREVCQKKACFTCSLRSGLPPQLWRYQKSIRRSLENIDLFLSPSRYTAQKHLESFPHLPIRILPTFSGSVLNTDQSQISREGFIYAGRLTRAKGVDDLIGHFKELPQYKLTLAGDGELAPYIKSTAKRYKNIHYTGLLSQKSILQHFRRARSLILPSKAPEVFPLVVLEAMSQGLPVIARKAGGSGEALELTKGGQVVSSESQMKEAIQLIAHDDILWKEQSQCAIKGYLDHYTEDIYIDAYLAYIYNIVERKGSRNLAPSGRPETP